MPTPNAFAKQLHAKFGVEYHCDMAAPDWSPVKPNCNEYREHVAQVFEDSASCETPLVAAAYAAFEAELYAQFEFLRSNGVVFHFTWDDPVDPETGLPSYKYTAAEFERTDMLSVFRSKDNEYPLLNRPYCLGAELITANDIFRAVHDFLGHLASGGSFSERGEKIAYLSHYKLFGPLARRALYTETVAQNAYYNTHKEFAPQKVMLFPVDFHAVPLK